MEGWTFTSRGARALQDACTASQSRTDAPTIAAVDVSAEMSDYMRHGIEGAPNYCPTCGGDRRMVNGCECPMDVCAACGQTVLVTPNDPPQTLLCDVCLASLERRRETRRANAALNQGGLF